MKAILLWTFTIGGILAGQLLEGGHVGSVLQGTAAIIVFTPIFAFLFYTLGSKGFLKFWGRVLSGKIEATDVSVIDTAVTVGFLAAGMGAILGMIHVMENLADTSKLGAGIAVSFVSAVYGALPALLLLPVKHRAQPEVAVTSQLKKAAGFMMFVMFMLGGTFMTVLYATSSTG